MTIVEIDLDASLNYGMPVMLHEGDFTCKTPLNVGDLDLFNSMTALPVPRPLDETTDSVLQVLLARSLSLRLQVLGTSVTRIEDVQTRILELEMYTQRLPPELHSADPGSTKNDLRQAFGIVSLDISLRRVLSYCYRSYIKDLTGPPPTTSLQNSLTILAYQKSFDPEIQGTDICKSEKYWDLFHILFKNDVMQAALDVCFHARTKGLVSWTKASLLLAIDDTIANLIRRISRNGSDIKDVLRLSVISQLVKSQIMPGNREEMMQDGAYKVLVACRKAREGEHTWEDSNVTA